MKLFAGSGCPDLAFKISETLQVPLSDITIGKFSDGETNVEINEHVRGEVVFIIQSTGRPANDNLMELAIIADALKRSSAKEIIAVIPYYGYGRQDRRTHLKRTAVTSKLIAKLLETSGITHVITTDIHSDQQQGFFNVPFVNTSAMNIYADHIIEKYGTDVVVISPDLGGVTRARALAKRLGDEHKLVIIDKRRPRANSSEVMNIIGQVDKDQTCVLIDDMADTAGTLTHCAKALKNVGAGVVVAYVTHAVLSGPAYRNITESFFDQIYISDTIPVTVLSPKIDIISVADMLASTMKCIYDNESISVLHNQHNI